MIIGLNAVRDLHVFIKYETKMCKAFLSPTKPLFKVISHIYIDMEIGPGLKRPECKKPTQIYRLCIHLKQQIISKQ